MPWERASSSLGGESRRASSALSSLTGEGIVWDSRGDARMATGEEASPSSEASVGDDESSSRRGGRDVGVLFLYHVTPRQPLRKTASQNGGGPRTSTPYSSSSRAGSQQRYGPRGRRREVRFSEEVVEHSSGGSTTSRVSPAAAAAAAATDTTTTAETGKEKRRRGGGKVSSSPHEGALRAAPYSLRSSRRYSPQPPGMQQQERAEEEQQQQQEEEEDEDEGQRRTSLDSTQDEYLPTRSRETGGQIEDEDEIDSAKLGERLTRPPIRGISKAQQDPACIFSRDPNLRQRFKAGNSTAPTANVLSQREEYEESKEGRENKHETRNANFQATKRYPLTKDSQYFAQKQQGFDQKTIERTGIQTRISRKHPQVTPKSSTLNGWLRLFIILLLLACIAVGGWYLFPHSLPQNLETNVLQKFQKQLTEVMSSYPSQDKMLWKRVQTVFEKHINSSRPPTKPVTLLFTAAKEAETALKCLTNQIADIFSASQNATTIKIDGASKATLDSDAVKLDVDELLNTGFQKGKKAVVVHRFEALPPASTLIFYKYCDHENAAFKNVALLLTVLLDEETLGKDIGLLNVEEKVRDFLWAKFTNSDTLSSHSRMDTDKLSGLWSRISHLVLPVWPEDVLHQKDCLQMK